MDRADCTVSDSTGEGGYARNNRRISINLKLQALCQEEGGGFLNTWEHFEQGDQLFSKDGLHFNKRDAAVLGKGLLRALENFLKTRTEWGGGGGGGGGGRGGVRWEGELIKKEIVSGEIDIMRLI